MKNNEKFSLSSGKNAGMITLLSELVNKKEAESMHIISFTSSNSEENEEKNYFIQKNCMIKMIKDLAGTG